MKLELVKETTWDKETWYCIYLDDMYMAGSYNQEKVDNIYAEAISDPENYFKRKKEILKSQEINVNL
jgi:hypothetical protein